VSYLKCVTYKPYVLIFVQFIVVKTESNHLGYGRITTIKSNATKDKQTVSV